MQVKYVVFRENDFHKYFYSTDNSSTSNKNVNILNGRGIYFVKQVQTIGMYV